MNKVFIENSGLRSDCDRKNHILVWNGIPGYRSQELNKDKLAFNADIFRGVVFPPSSQTKSPVCGKGGNMNAPIITCMEGNSQPG